MFMLPIVVNRDSQYSRQHRSYGMKARAPLDHGLSVLNGKNRFAPNAFVVEASHSLAVF